MKFNKKYKRAKSCENFLIRLSLFDARADAKLILMPPLISVINN